MADMKRSLRINWYKVMIVLLLIGWVIWMYVDDTHLSQDGLATKTSFVMGLLLIIFGFLASVFIWQAKIRSAKTIHCHGSDTWDPAEWHEIPEVTSPDGRIATPRLLIRGVGGFKAMGVYLGGKGAKGWDVVVDYPGIWERIGSNLVVRTAVKETFVGKYEHKRIHTIIDRLNTYLLGIPGMITIAEDTPLNVFAIPLEREGIDKTVLDHFASMEQVRATYDIKLGDKDDTILDLQMRLDEIRGVQHGQTNWMSAVKPKGGENTGPEQPERQQ